jgi:hypothetical protein
MGPELDRNWKPPPPPQDPGVDDPTSVAGKYRQMRREVRTSLFPRFARRLLVPVSESSLAGVTGLPA